MSHQFDSVYYLDKSHMQRQVSPFINIVVIAVDW